MNKFVLRFDKFLVKAMEEIKRSGNKSVIIFSLIAIVLLGITITSAYLIINAG